MIQCLFMLVTKSTFLYVANFHFKKQFISVYIIFYLALCTERLLCGIDAIKHAILKMKMLREKHVTLIM